MDTQIARIRGAIILALLSCVAAGRSEGQQPAAAPSPCVADSSFRRLAFWVGDWEVLDSTGARYATQRVQDALDGCAITAEWRGPRGGEGLSMFAFDRRAGEWRQIYVSNQVPSPSGIQLRRSDPTYDGPGLRFIALVEPSDGNPSRSRVTIMPLGGGRVLQLFESSSDGGRTWRTLFKGVHRPLHRAGP